jgi:NitT/TauT family transport system permease protein
VTTRRIVTAGIVGIVVFGTVWELFVRLFDVEPFILLPPSQIVGELADRPRFYLEAAVVTARHAAAGIAISLAVAVLCGSVLAASRFVEQAAQPVLVGVLVAPWVAYFTSIVVWLGPGDPPVIFLVAFVTTPAFVFATVAGMRSADPAARELLASVDAGSWEMLWRLRLPSALSSIFAAARYNVGLALAAAYYGEGGNLTTSGLGAAGRRAANQNAEVLWATILATVGLGVVFLGVISVIERIALRWHVSQRTRGASNRTV